MRKFTLFIIYMIAYASLFSQTVDYVEFDYDAAGNRTTREVIYLKSSVVDDPQAHHETGFQPAVDSVEFKGKLGNREISIYPNPTKGSLTIAIAGEEEACPATLALFSLTGEVILRHQIRQPSTTLDLSGHPPGTYLLQITTAAGRETCKVVKE
jgi:hypothetical protein